VIFPSGSELKLREGLFVLVLLSPAAGLLADAQSLDRVRLSLNILVRNQFYQPVVNARIRISPPDRSAGGPTHPEVEGFTDAEGKFVRPNTEFQLAGSSFELTVAARGFESSRTLLTDEMLRDSLKRGQLFTTVLLKPLSAGESDPVEPSLARAEATPGAITAAATGSPATLVSPASFFQDLYGRGRSSVFLPWIVGAAVLVILQTVALAWLLRSRLRLFTEPELTVSYLKAMTRALEGLRRAQEQSLAQQKDLLAQIASNNDILLNGVSIISIHEEAPQAGFAIHPASAPAAEAPLPFDELSSRTSLSEARQSYLKLINRTPLAREPIYLDVEMARSIAGRLEDPTVYLESVSHSQGALVLFTTNDESGWVFPNPTIGWRKAAVRDVFPALTESEFALAKADILPRRAEKVSTRRWRVIDL
jgi:hypothetical protein